ncbi:MAG: RNA methyltransferase, partial [Bacteroidetes bacterium]|nr:RNA methyltransferase [Bacteroidota bacterium]
MSDILALHHKKYRQARGMFFAEGRKIISELMHSTFLVDAVFGSERFIAELRGLPAAAGLTFEITDEAELRKMSALSNPQDGFALCRIPQVREPHFQSDKVYLYLDAIRDPGNMGSLIRLADWFGVEAVICSSDCVEWTNPKVIQASMGSFIRKTPFVEAGEPGSFLAGKNRVFAAD